MKFKKILLLYKKSTYQYYFVESRGRQKLHPEIRHFRKTHNEHYDALRRIEGILQEKGFTYDKAQRGSKIDFLKYQLIITVGGDGTFLEAARQLRNQFILGVNSDPQWSVGFFCSATRESLPPLLEKISRDEFKVLLIKRMRLKLRLRKIQVNVLNDVLVCHKNPAAMSRYMIYFKGKKEEQKSSGIWVSTPAGSTGAICSAGGAIFPKTGQQLQFIVREPYHRAGKPTLILKGLFCEKTRLKCVSKMNDGAIFVDGSHERYPFPIGEQAVFSDSPEPLRVIAG